jgi:hypothetical protein
MSSASTALVAATTTSAATRWAWRPTTLARTSSARPVSSSARVCRTTASTLIRPTMIAMKPSIWWLSIDPKW